LQEVLKEEVSSKTNILNIMK